MTELTLEQANRLIAAVLAKARTLALPPVAVAVLDSGGHLKALQRQDGVSFLRVQICQAKAWGALGLGIDSAQIAERYQLGGVQTGFIDALNSATGGRVVPLPGGVLIRDEHDRLLGAVGAAGGPSDLETACVIAGVEAIGARCNPQQEG